jgi:arylsulfatase A-like enzyme
MKDRNNPLRDVKRLCLNFLIIIIIVSVSLSFIHCNKKKVIDKKQIILISIDTLRGDHLSSYGYFRDTSPNLSKLIEDAVYYPNAYPNGCWTMPSHMSLLTGTLPSRHGINRDWKSMKNRKYQKVSESIKNIAEILHSHNITTLKFARLPKGLGFSKGFETDKPIDPFSDDKKFDTLLKALENNKKKDFLLFIHTWMVHAPYCNSFYLEKGKVNKKKRQYINNFRKTAARQEKAHNIKHRFGGFLKKNNLFNVNDCKALYDGGIRYVDQYIGSLINKCKQLGIYRDLLFVVVSDHGEHFAEHYRNEFYGCHGKDFYEEFIKVPLIIKYPEKTIDPGTWHYPVSLVDVLPTILDLYHIKIPGFVQGESLLKPHSKRSKTIISEAVSMPRVERKMIRRGNLKYIITMKNPSNPGRFDWDSIIQRKLFDLKTDPLEKNNLYKDLEYRQASIEFEKELFKIITDSVKLNRSQKETEISEETIKNLEALGYL